METQEKTEKLARLVRASGKGDVAAIRALLESGNVDVSGRYDDWVRLLSTLRQRTLCSTKAPRLKFEMAGPSPDCGCGMLTDACTLIVSLEGPLSILRLKEGICRP
jgi:hypothetical protein